MLRRTLTKSRFQIACQCPTKLFYVDQPIYSNIRQEDSFLEALAEGGYQVHELAKYYYPHGIEIGTLNTDQALLETKKHMETDAITLYESAFLHKSLFIRIDILVKRGTHLDLYEVKAKSYVSDSTGLVTKKGFPSATWRPYLYDVAFQKYVLQKACPTYTVQAYLAVMDKNAKCPTDGLNQKFTIKRDATGRKLVVAHHIQPEDLEPPLLKAINVDSICHHIYTNKSPVPNDFYESLSFSEKVQAFSEAYSSQTKLPPVPTKACGNCEFVLPKTDIKGTPLLSGKEECWREITKDPSYNTSKKTILSLWNYRHKERCIQQKKFYIQDLTKEDIQPKTDDKPGLSVSQRQWMQVQKEKENDPSVWIDRDNLLKEVQSWTYPLHLIDFETTMVALPFHKNRHPYEGIAFQFSHHTLQADGTVSHAGEFISTKPGFFPNIEFVRHLKNQLETDDGTIFRYSHHENTFLTMIYSQLNTDPKPVPDQKELCHFIQTITKSTSKQSEKWIGNRNMVDLCELVKRYFYDPQTEGSNSIKKVLPAILSRSQFLQKKYSNPIYGSKDGLSSHNFENWTWCQYTNNQLINPYDLLPDLFQDIPDDKPWLLSTDDRLQDGGAALTAYARMQFSEMTEYERKEIRKALLKYCELDTLAMVFMIESWIHDYLFTSFKPTL
jgi:hypothetical protein